MPTTGLGITFEELEKSPRLTVGLDGVEATRRFLVSWDDWALFVEELYGAYREVGGTVVYSQTTAPFSSGRPYLLIERVDVEPFDGNNPSGTSITGISTGLNSYAGGALVTAHYRERWGEGASQMPTAPNGTYLTYTTTIGMDVMTVTPTTGASGWKWANGDALDPSTPVFVQIPATEHVLTWDRVLRPPFGAIRSLTGKVNQNVFLGFEAETLLFTGAKLNKTFQARPDSPQLWRVEYTFAQQRKFLSGGGIAGWNHFWRGKAISGEHWQKVTYDSPATKYVYDAGDFTALFLFE